ncbi:hypothetical protein ACJJTC_019740 [Scirpophaga incertulas]
MKDEFTDQRCFDEKRLEPCNEVVGAAVHALLSAVEQQQAAGQYRGDGAALPDYCAADGARARVLTARCVVCSLSGSATRVLTARCVVCSLNGSASPRADGAVCRARPGRLGARSSAARRAL